MTQEERQLFLIDLCARLPYGVKLKTGNNALSLDMFYFDDGLYKTIEKVITAGYKMYLRPMSSMTDEEWDEISKIDWKRGIMSSRHLTLCMDGEVIDLLNKKMLDWRGLIEKGLALEAPDGMYN